MRPNYQDLGLSVGKQVIASDLAGGDTNDVFTPQDAIPSQMQSRIQLLEHGGNLQLNKTTNGWQQGMWVHYRPRHATFGVARPGQKWAASGPFSGCHLSIGQKDGKMYIAHIAKESGSNAEAQWNAKTGDWDEWARMKIGAYAPVGLDINTHKANASIVFVDWFAGEDPDSLQITRVEFESSLTGGFTAGAMRISKVASLPMAKCVEWS